MNFFSNRTRVILVALQLLFFSALVYSQTIQLKIIQTTDEHGAIFPYSFVEKKETANSLAQFMSYIKEERANTNQEIILLSGGDFLQGTPAVYYYNFEKTDVPHIKSEIMNYIGYDAAAVGNHDIETGHAVYDKFNKELKFPWLAANAVKTSDGNPYFKPYTIIERKEIRVAILGMITPNIPNWLPRNIWEGMEFNDMVESARKWVTIIKEKEMPDLIVGLFHSGVDYTYGNQNADTYKNENAVKLVAQRVPGFDIIFCGHDHRGWNITVSNSEWKEVNILGATSSARDAAVANITFDFDNAQKKWRSKITGDIVEMKNYKPDQDFMNKFNGALNNVKKYVGRKVGYFTESVSARESIFGSSAFVDLINKVQLELTGADISFTAPLSFNANIEKGDIFVSDLFELYRYENLLYTMELSGLEIKNYLEYTSDIWFNQMKDENDHLLNFVKDAAGNLILERRNNMPLLKSQYYNFDSAMGIDYTVNVSKPYGNRVNILSFSNGSKFYTDKKYKVALNSYRGNGGGNHLTQGAGIPKEELEKRILFSTDRDLRYYVMKWIENQKTITPKSANNWKVIPESWWKKGKEKDFKLIYK